MARHSLWLVPRRSDPVFRELRAVIDDLAGRFDTPAFDPHITLLGGLDGLSALLRAAAKRLSDQITPCEIRLGAIVSPGEYFRRVVSAVEQTPELLGAHKHATAAMGGATDPYWPHLSLAYGDLDARQTAALMAVAEAAEVAGRSFTASTLQLWRTEGHAEQWSCVTSMPLRSARGR